MLYHAKIHVNNLHMLNIRRNYVKKTYKKNKNYTIYSPCVDTYCNHPVDTKHSYCHYHTMLIKYMNSCRGKNVYQPRWIFLALDP